MNETDGRGDRLFSALLVATGLGFFLIYPMAMVWPAGWSWHHGDPAANDYFLMIVGVYATLGYFLIRAARDPGASRSLIRFTIWSSVVHGLIMGAEALRDPRKYAHLVGDVPALLLVAIVLALFLRRYDATSRLR